MSDVPDFMMRRLSERNTLAEISQALADAREAGWPVPSIIGRKEGLLKNLNRIQDEFWEERAAAARKAGQKGGQATFAGISGAECNAWLQTLPPVPLWGEASA